MSYPESPAELLRRAEVRIRELADAVERELHTNPYWERLTYTEGVRNALGGPTGDMAATWHPAVVRAVADWLAETAREWAWNGVGWQEAEDAAAITAARAVLGEPQDGGAR